MSSTRIIEQLKENIDLSNKPITVSEAKPSLSSLPACTISDDALVIKGRLLPDDAPKLYIGEWKSQVVVVKEYAVNEEYSTFHNEAEIMQKLSLSGASHFVKCFGFSANASHYRIVMEHVSHGDLLNWLMDFYQSNARLPIYIAYTLLKNIAVAIEDLHIMDVIHCDLKWENITLADNYTVKLIDYEYAKCLGGSDFLFHARVSGTIGYAAPEVYSHQLYSKAGDVFSFGSMMYCMYEKTMPWDYDNMTNEQKVAMIMSGQQPGFTNKTPEPMVKLIKSCWDLRPLLRPTMSRVCKKLDAFFQKAASKEVSSNGVCNPDYSLSANPSACKI